MNKAISKWPSKVLNLLVVLSMVIALSAILVAPPVAAQEAPCPRAIEYNGCHLSVAVNTYIKVDGNFIVPTSTYAGMPVYNPPVGDEEFGDCFYVNAVVVNDGNETADYPINATISFPPGTIYLDTAYESYSKIWPGSQTDDFLAPGRIADFWWKVCCDSPNGTTPIRVNVTAGVVDTQPPQCWGEDTTYVYQGKTEEQACVEIKIVEAPGLGPVTGRLLGNDSLPIVYDSGMPDTVQPCQNFGIKAEITNLCEGTVTVGNVHIDWDGEAILVGIDPDNWPVGDLDGNETAVVAWTLHCEGPGEVNVNVTAPDASGITDLEEASVTVHQQTPGGLVVEITQPTAEESCLDGSDLTIKQPTGLCGAQKFLVKATVTYTGAGEVTDVYAQISASRSSGWVTLPASTNKSLGTLQSMVPKPVDFGNVTCIGEGLGNITVRGYSLQDPNPPAEDTKFVTISQQKVIATVDPTYTSREVVNICDPDGFDVSFRYYNWSDLAWGNISGNSVTACIDWDGNVALESVSWRKITAPQQVPPQAPTWILLNENPTPIDNQDCEVIPEVICACCAFDVKWHFKCTGEGEVTFYGNVTVNDQTHSFYGGDTSEPVCIEQEWKADLWTDILFFFQDEYGVMIEQDAMVPGNDFHVVIPVINTGDATAEDVKVYFTITDTPTAPCTRSYTYKSYSGDATLSWSFDQQTGIGTGTATFAHIPGHSAEKVVLLLHCNCEGRVSVLIPEHMEGVLHWTDSYPGMKAFDANTWDGLNHLAVPNADIHVPPCPMVFEQVPFTVEIENPEECQTFIEGDVFSVKALIHNGSQQLMVDVNATLSATDGTGTSILGDTVILVGSQNNPKFVGNITAGLDTEITWVLECHGGGEVYLKVCASSTTPMLTACSEEVNVHQTEVVEPDLEVKIMSPVAIHTMIATGEQFAVSAMVANWGDGVAEDVQVAIGDYDGDVEWYRTNATIYLDDWCITPGSETVWVLEKGEEEPVEQVRGVDYIIDNYALGLGHFINIPPVDAVVSASWIDQFSLVDSEMVQDIGDLGPDETKIVTWTLRAETTCDGGCMVDDEPIFVTAWGSNACYERAPMVFVDIYPAAHLVTVIGTITPASPFVVCEEFNVSYTVYNIGQADAWNTSVTLSVEPAGSVRIAGGETGYTQMLGTIPGYDSGALEQRGNATGTFKLHCKMACESTITITPYGYDECGIHFVDPTVGMGPPRNGPDFLGYVEEPGRAIDPKFLEPASKTVKQVVSGGVDLSIDKTADNLFPATGQTVKFTVVVTNNGPADATGIVVSDAIPSGLNMTGHIKTQGTYTGGVWTVGSLNAGSSATLVITCTRLASPSGAITNTATITTLGQVDPFSNNNMDSVTLNKAEVASMNIDLKSGWNLISLPLIPNSSAIGTVLNLIKTHVVMVWAYDPVLYPPTGFAFWDPDDVGSSTLPIMRDGPGYWINMDAAITLTINGKVNPTPPTQPPTYDVYVGWNLIGFKSTYDQTALEYLAAINGQYTKIWGFANGQYHPVSTSDMLQPGFGYWIAVTLAGTIYP